MDPSLAKAEPISDSGSASVITYLGRGKNKMCNDNHSRIEECGIISKIKVLHLKIKVYMKNVAVFTH